MRTLCPMISFLHPDLLTSEGKDQNETLISKLYVFCVNDLLVFLLVFFFFFFFLEK